MYPWQHDHAHNLSVLVILMHGIQYMWYVAEYWTTHRAFISMGWCKKNVPPLLTHWSYVCLALTHWYPHGFNGESCTYSGYTTKLIRIHGDRQWSIMHQEEGWCITLSILFSYHLNRYINIYIYINACNLCNCEWQIDGFISLSQVFHVIQHITTHCHVKTQSSLVH